MVDLPQGSRPISSKWIFKKKLKPDSSINKYEARLVTRGFDQRKGIDYFDTYFSVIKIVTVRTLVALAVIHNLVVHQMNMKTVFINDELEDKIICPNLRDV